MNWNTKLTTRIKKTNSRLCVGLDIDSRKIPTRFSVVSYAKHIIDTTEPYVIAYKPNLAYFESRGNEGIKNLEEILCYVRQTYPDVLLIADAKRGDIGSTMEQYMKGIFDTFMFDAVTVNPYLGKEAVQPALDRKDKGIIIVCKTSNPGSGEFQDLVIDGKKLWQHVAVKVKELWNNNDNCMLVIGATYPQELKDARTLMGDDMFFLVPGVGKQGGTIQDVVTQGGSNVIINVGRSILEAADPGKEAKILVNEMQKYLN